MSDYRYGDVISMQEAAIRRVNEMQRRAREAARLANQQLSHADRNIIKEENRQSSRQPDGYAEKTARHTNLPVDYLHGTDYPQKPRSDSDYSGNPDEKSTGQSESQRSKNAAQNNIHGARRSESGSFSSTGKPPQNSWAQSAVNKHQRPSIQHSPGRPDNGKQSCGTSLRQHQPPNNKNCPGGFTFGDKGVFSALGGVVSGMDNDTILLLGLLYILWRDGADYGLLFALFYILM